MATFKSFEIGIVAINLITFFLCGLDKYKAQRGLWRIPEKSFLLMAAAFGAGGILVGMKVFRHKTRHPLFTIGMPCMLAFNLVCLYYLKGFLF
ncbi:MAG: DUF1294 domain-containing protein [Peptococcia bacterium]|jgi:uncharacterized membrane protein YsdA (DUF1294 family)